MRAVWYDRTGTARDVLQLGDQPKPQAGQGQVLIAVKASGVNPSDVGMRGGASGAPMAYPKIIPHSDGAGVVEAVGPGVSPAWVGRRVWFYNGQRNGRAFGAAAEYIELDVDLVRALPNDVSFAEGATLGDPHRETIGIDVHGAHRTPTPADGHAEIAIRSLIRVGRVLPGGLSP